MQKWEYLIVTAEVVGNAWRPKYVNDQEVPNWKNGISLYAYANQLGERGWELVAAPYTSLEYQGTTSDTAGRLIFKRPIE